MSRDVRRNRRSFEALENRVMLASDAVTAVVNGTNLTITGDGNDDTFLVSGDGTSDGSVTITGFTSAGANTTLINGAPSVTLTGVTGNITLNLGAGDVTVSVADLAAQKNVTITAAAGDDTIAVGTAAALTTPTGLTTNVVTVGGNLSIRAGGGDDTITVGETPASGTDVTVSGSTSITVGNGDDTITELSLAVSRDETIYAGSGDDTVTIGGATVTGSGVTIGRDLTVYVGGGDDTVTETSLTVTRSESLSVGSGDDTITLGEPAITLGGGTISANARAVHAAAIKALVTEASDAGVSIGRDLDVQMGSGDSSLNATNVQVGETLLITGAPLFSFFGFGGFGHRGAPPAVDTITLTDVTADGAGIFTGFNTSDNVTITGSTFGDLGVGLGTGGGVLTIGSTTTTSSTTLVGLGSGNSYVDGLGNTFAHLHTFGLTPAPTTPSVVAAHTTLRR